MHHLQTTCVWRRRALAVSTAVLAASIFGIGGCASTVADGSLLARTDAVLRAGQPNTVRLTISPDTITTGGLLTASVQAGKAGFVYLYQVGTDGKSLTLVFPNEFDTQNSVVAGQALNLPRPNWRLRAQGPAGVGYLLAILTEDIQITSTLSKATGDGRYQLEGAYGAAMVTLKEIAAR